MGHINTEPLWEQMSEIAAEVVYDIKEILKESNVPEIKTVWGTVYIDPEDDEVALRAGEKIYALAEMAIDDILRIAYEVNDFVSEQEDK